MAVRPAVAEDALRLAELYQLATEELAPVRGGRVLLGLGRRPEPVAASFRRQVDDPGTVLVVGMVGPDVVGYGSGRTFELAGEDAERLAAVEELYVLPGARRQGVGRALGRALVAWSLARGCAGVDASALPGSRAVKSFFESEGFTARLLVMHRRLP